MTELEKLDAAGWDVSLQNGAAMLRPKGCMPDVGWARVNLNADGTLHLVTERSDFHRKLRNILNAAPVVSDGDYQPRVYGA